MSELTDESRKLNWLIMSSDEYKDYLAALDRLKENTELCSELQHFRDKYRDVLRYGEGNPYDELLKLYYDHDRLLHNAIVSEYLEAESTFTRLIKRVISDITEGLRIDIPE